MDEHPKILAWAGSARAASFNKSLLRIAVEGARTAGGDVTSIDLADYPLPIFHQDEEAEHGHPAPVRQLKDLMLANRGFLIAAPEYNSSITPLLKNMIDWTSRPVPGEAPLNCFTGKVVVIMSASPGALGGMRGLVHLRAILGNIGAVVLPATFSVSQAATAFNADGTLVDPAKQKAVQDLGAKLLKFLRKLDP